jgi:hypothetical protein
LVIAITTVPYLTDSDKKGLRAAYFPGLDTVLQRDWLRNQPKDLPELMFKSALLLSKVYLTDGQIADHRSIWRLLGDPHFRKLLADDFDNKPAIIVGLRKGCQTLIDAIDTMISNKMIFSSLCNSPQIQRMINNSKITSSQQLFDRLDKTGYTYRVLKETSTLLKERKIPVWQAKLDPERYFNLVKNFTIEVSKNERTENDFRKIALKFKACLESKKTEEVKCYSRSKAEKDLESVVRVRGVETAMRHFKKLCIDFPYNLNVSFTNPMGIVWHEGPYTDELIRNFRQSLGNLIGREAIERTVIQLQEYRKIAMLLKIVDFRFIYELRTGDSRNEFKNGIDRIANAKTTHDRWERTKDHLNFVFDKIAESWQEFKKNQESKKIMEQEFPNGIQYRIWDKLEPITGTQKLVDQAASLGTLVPLLVNAIGIREYLYFIEPLSYLASLISGVGTACILTLRGLRSLDRFRYPQPIRILKQEFSTQFVREVSEPYVTD